METVSRSLGPGAGRPRSPLSARGLAQASPAGLLVLPSPWAAPAGQGAPCGPRLLGAFLSPGHSGPIFLLSPPTQPLKGKEGVPGPAWLSGRPCGQGPCEDLGKRVQADRWPRQRPRGAAAPGGRSGASRQGWIPWHLAGCGGSCGCLGWQDCPLDHIGSLSTEGRVQVAFWDRVLSPSPSPSQLCQAWVSIQMLGLYPSRLGRAPQGIPPARSLEA